VEELEEERQRSQRHRQRLQRCERRLDEQEEELLLARERSRRQEARIEELQRQLRLSELEERRVSEPEEGVVCAEFAAAAAAGESQQLQQSFTSDSARRRLFASFVAGGHQENTGELTPSEPTVGDGLARWLGLDASIEGSLGGAARHGGPSPRAHGGLATTLCMPSAVGAEPWLHSGPLGAGPLGSPPGVAATVVAATVGSSGGLAPTWLSSGSLAVPAAAPSPLPEEPPSERRCWLLLGRWGPTASERPAPFPMPRGGGTSKGAATAQWRPF
jgi:hypothetical protein